MLEKHQYVFISYSSKNQQMADSIRMIFIEKGIPCWMAPYDIPVGSKYAYVINDALENCSCLLLLLTNASQESQFVEREIERAVTYKKPIIPMQLEDIQLNSGFKFYIGSSQIVAVPEIKADSAQFEKVLQSVCSFVGFPKTFVFDKGTNSCDSEVINRIKQCQKINSRWSIKSEEKRRNSAKTIIRLSDKHDESIECLLQVRTLIQRTGRYDQMLPEEKESYDKELTYYKTAINAEHDLLALLKNNRHIVQILETIFLEWQQDDCFGCDLLIRHEPLISLQEKIGEGLQLSEDEVIQIGQDIALALDACHKRCLIHRDINPEDIFINRYGSYKLGFFSTAVTIDDLDGKRMRDLIYRPAYAAPEQASGAYDLRADIYSLGLVLYQLTNKNKLPLTQSRLSGKELPPPSTANSKLSTVLLKACSFSPQSRYDSANTFYTALNHICSKMYKTPMIKQRNATECGAAALAMIFSYWGKAISLDQLCAETNVSPDGCNAGDIMRTAKRFGLDCHGYRKELSSLLKVEMPCIIHWNYCHFLVLEDVQADRAMINDPATGHREITLKELEKGYSGIVLTFHPTNDW